MKTNIFLDPKKVEKKARHFASKGFQDGKKDLLQIMYLSESMGEYEYDFWKRVEKRFYDITKKDPSSE